ncbi:fatty acid desaturase [uncultured Sphingomonas sp.]|uniref:fatty acid desaturase n=1 Tax=uncultured Sphingomonas sp. TaxID=158754 RepID=UPI0035C9E868
MTTADKRRQTRIGLTLATLITGVWLAIHVAGIFFWRWTPASIPLAAVLVVVQAWLSTGLFIVAHDAMHGALAPGRPRVNRAVGIASLALYAGLSFGRLEPKHHLHHRHVGTADDPDFSADHPRSAPRWFAAFFRSYYSHAQIARITAVALIYTLVLGASLGNIVVFWAVPALLALGQLFLFGTYLPHRHADEPFADRHRARSTRIGPLLSLLTCYHFGGYHHEHHLSPNTPWWALPGRRRARGSAHA